MELIQIFKQKMRVELINSIENIIYSQYPFLSWFNWDGDKKLLDCIVIFIIS